MLLFVCLLLSMDLLAKTSCSPQKEAWTNRQNILWPPHACLLHACLPYSCLPACPICLPLPYRRTLQSCTGPEQGQIRGFPVKFSTQGKTCFHYREPMFSLQGPCIHYREFPVRITTQGNPCSHYRECVCSSVGPKAKAEDLRPTATVAKVWSHSYSRRSYL